MPLLAEEDDREETIMSAEAGDGQDTRYEWRSGRTEVRVKADEDGDEKTLSGLAAVFYDGTEGSEYQLWEGVVERIMPGAFSRSIEDGDDVRALFNHDSNQILGRTRSDTLSLAETDQGLGYNVALPDTHFADDLRVMVDRRDVDGSSFGFLVREEKWIVDEENDREIREIHDARLLDVGPVTFPAYENTTAAVRSHRRWQEERNGEEAPEKPEPSETPARSGRDRMRMRLELAKRK